MKHTHNIISKYVGIISGNVEVKVMEMQFCRDNAKLKLLLRVCYRILKEVRKTVATN